MNVPSPCATDTVSPPTVTYLPTRCGRPPARPTGATLKRHQYLAATADAHHLRLEYGRRGAGRWAWDAYDTRTGTLTLREAHVDDLERYLAAKEMT